LPNLVEKTSPDHPQTPDRILSTQEEFAQAAAEEQGCIAGSKLGQMTRD
jgi:hypothetical protein